MIHLHLPTVVSQSHIPSSNKVLPICTVYHHVNEITLLLILFAATRRSKWVNYAIFPCTEWWNMMDGTLLGKGPLSNYTCLGRPKHFHNSRITHVSSNASKQINSECLLDLIAVIACQDPSLPARHSAGKGFPGLPPQEAIKCEETVSSQWWLWNREHLQGLSLEIWLSLFSLDKHFTRFCECLYDCCLNY